MFLPGPGPRAQGYTEARDYHPELRVYSMTYIILEGEVIRGDWPIVTSAWLAEVCEQNGGSK